MECNFATYEQDKEDYILRGKYLFESGITNYRAFGDRLVKEFGNEIKPYVDDIWSNVQDTHAASIRLGRYTPEAREAIERGTKDIGFEKFEENIGPISTEEVILRDARKHGYVVDLAKRGRVPPDTAFNGAQLRAMASELDKIAEIGWKDISETPKLKDEFINLLLTLEQAGGTWGRAGVEQQRLISPKTAEILVRVNQLSADERFQKALDKMIKEQKLDAGDWNKLAEWSRNIKLASTSSLVRSTVGNTTAQILRLVNTPVSYFYNKLLSGLTGIPQDRFAKEASIELLATVKNLGKSVDTMAGLWREDPATVMENPFYQNEGFRMSGAIGTQAKASKIEQLLYKLVGKKPPEVPVLEKKLGKFVRKAQIAQSIIDAAYRIPTMYSVAERLAYRAAMKQHPKDAVKAQEMFEKLTNDIYSGELDADSFKILQAATKEGAYSTFQAQLGHFGSQFNSIRTRFPLTQLIVPFFNTWSNLWKYGIRHTPLNVLTGQFREALKKAYSGPKEIRELGPLTDELAAITTGTMATMIAGGVLGILTGGITGKGPDNKNEYDRLLATGWLPYSIKLGDKYVSYRSYEPISTWLGIMADLNEGYKKEGAIGAFADASSNMIENFVSNPFLLGTTDLIDSIRGRKKPEDFLASMALGMTIPTFMSQVARVIDPVQREGAEKGAPFLERLGGAYARRIPFVSKTLPSRLTPFGQEETVDYPATRLVGLTISKDEQDAVLNELNRLKTGVGFPSNVYKDFELPPEVHRQLIISSGQATHKALSVLMQSEGYEQLDDEQKRNAVDYIKNNIRNSVKELMLEPGKNQLLEYFKKKSRQRSQERPERALTKRILGEQSFEGIEAISGLPQFEEL